MQQILDGIGRDGFCVINDFLPYGKITLLADEAKRLLEAGAMRRARTGQGNAAAPDSSVRGDFIHWLDEEQDTSSAAGATLQEYFARMHSLRENLHREFYLGLLDIESHFTIYPPGAIYRKHLDQFRGNEQRQVSSILYLNQGWQHAHGGQLRLYLNGSESTPYRDIEPMGGTLVLFLSGRFWHEVLPATQQRISLTGWLRTRA
ncbi:MAG TPA: 2OG-Fe(II) oxygenase [Methylophilaceae bacterium]|nr:2OG-Fe(II) oxygenase [Methylophilaceae bacterium]